MKQIRAYLMGKCTVKNGVIVFFVMLLLGLHFYRLLEVPFGINIDEAGSSYDAWCLANFGVDRYQKSYPVYFINYGGGQNALLTYLLMVVYKVFGYSGWYIRGIMSGACLITAYFGCKLTKLWANDSEKEEILFLGLFTTMPIFIMLFRVGIESTLMLCTSTVFLYYFTKAVMTGKYLFYGIAGVAGGVMLYSYALAYLVLPMMLLFSFLYVMLLEKKDRGRTLVKWVLMAGVLLLFAFPLLWVQIINMFGLPEAHMGPFTITRLPIYRSGELSLTHFFQNLPWVYFYTHFYDHLPYNTLKEFGTMYYVSIPMIGIGGGYMMLQVYREGKEKRKTPYALLLFWYVAQMMMGAMLGNGSQPYSSCMNGIFVVLLCFAVMGIRCCHRWIGKWFMGALVVIYGVLFLSFAIYYFGDYTKEHQPDGSLFCADYGEVVSYLNSEQGQKYRQMPMYLENKYGYYAAAARVNPMEYDFSGEATTHIDQVYFGLPEELDYYGNYVIYKENIQSLEYLKDWGYRAEEIGNYVLMVSPLNDRTIQNLSVDNLQYQIDGRTFDKEGNFYVSGWIFQTDTKAPVDSLTVQGTNLEADALDRQDVTAAFELLPEAAYGFQYCIPKDYYENAGQIVLEANGEPFVQIQ